MCGRVTRNTIGLALALGFGALMGIGATLWFFAQTTRHVTELKPQDVLLPDDAPSVPDRVRIMELVCRDLLANRAADSARDVPSACFLKIGVDQDPPPELLAALGDLPFPVRSYSAGKLAGGRIVDKETGQPGLVLTIYRMWMRTRNEVHVRVRLDAGGTDAREFVWVVTRADNQWKATSREPLP